MSAEQLLVTSTDRAEARKPRHCLFIAGMMGTNSGIRAEKGIVPAFARAYGGQEHVTSFNSIVSTDKRNKQRFQQMAEVIKTHAAEGLDIVVHSLGVTELYRALTLIEKDDPEFFQDESVKANTRFVVIGPSGASKGFIERLAYPIRAALDVANPQYSGLTAFPPERVTEDQLTHVLADVSNKRDDVSTVVFPADTVRSNEEYLTEEEKRERILYDSLLRGAIAAEDTESAQRIIKERGKFTGRAVEQVFEGTPVVTPGKRRIPRYFGFQGLAVLTRAAGKKPMEKLVELYDMGYQVAPYVPELDTVKPWKKIVKFFGNRKPEITGVPGGHAGLGLQPDGYAQIIFSRGDRSQDGIMAE